jgi:hypothetical protein
MKLLGNFDLYVAIIKEKTGLAINPTKSKLLVSSPDSLDDGVRLAAAALGVQVYTDGIRVMGVPVGTDQFIEDDVGARLEEYVQDLHCLRYFTPHDQFALLLYCVNQRPEFMMRALDIYLAKESFAAFDAQVTDMLLEIMGVSQAHADLVRMRVDHMRGLRLSLSGLTVGHRSRPDVRVRAVRKSRDNVARFLERYEPGMLDIANEAWGAHQLPVVTIAPTDGFDADAARRSSDLVALHLKGHTIGDIPDSSVKRTLISGAPDLTVERKDARNAADADAMAADLVLHSRTMRGLADSHHSHNRQLAAQVLSSSCVNSGSAVRSVPTRQNHINGVEFQQTLRLRCGVPCVLPLGAWRCNCKAHGGPKQDHFRERVVAGNEGSRVAKCFKDQPLHGLICKRRWARVVYRHNDIRDVLMKALRRISGVVAAPEPRLSTSNQQRGDIRVTKGGTSWTVDVGVILPGTQSHVDKHRTHKVPGAAASDFERRKVQKYAGHVAEKFTPFIVETGGRLGAAALAFVDEIVDADTSRGRSDAHHIFTAISRSLVRQQGYMLRNIIEEIPRPDAAMEASV